MKHIVHSACATMTPARKLVTRCANYHAGLFVASFLFCCATLAFAQNSPADARVHIDVPTKLDKANVVIDFGNAVSFAMGDINFLVTDVRAWNAKGAIIVIFHGDAAYLVLNDETYNSNRHTTHGNPYKKALNDLMAQGAQHGLCGATAKANDWGNANLLPGIKVNANAMVRLSQLEQNGYTMIYQQG